MNTPLERFIADAMLGRLAHWLRILGYNTSSESSITDEALIERALSEDRWLLTRDRKLAERKVLRGRHSLIARDDVDGQLGQLPRDLHMDLDVPHHRGYRCAHCKVALTSLSSAEACSLVALFVADTYNNFLQCPHCDRVFWQGTHWEDMLRRLDRIRSGL